MSSSEDGKRVSWDALFPTSLCLGWPSLLILLVDINLPAHMVGLQTEISILLKNLFQVLACEGVSTGVCKWAKAGRDLRLSHILGGRQELRRPCCTMYRLL